MAAALAAWAATARPLQYAEPPLLPKCTRHKLLGEGVVGLSYLESRDGWPVPIHAVKYIPAQAVAEDTHAMRRELQNLQQLHHPNILAFFSAEATPGCTHLALLTEAVLGPGGVPWRISDCLKAQPGGRLEEPLARQIFAQLVSGLAYAHSQGVVHRDLTLDNVLVAQSLTGRFTVKLIDFGSSKNVFASLPASARRTEAAFAAPELLISEYNAARCLPFARAPPMPVDMWALGMLLLCALLGPAQLQAAAVAAAVTDVATLALSKGLVPFLRRVVLGLPSVSLDGQDVLLSLFTEDPESRLTAQATAAHAWLAAEAYVPPPMALPCAAQTREQLVDLVNAVAVAGGGQPIMA